MWHGGLAHVCDYWVNRPVPRFPVGFRLGGSLSPPRRRFGVLDRTALLDICSPRPASGRGAGGEGLTC